MDNYDIYDALGLYAKLAELHNENPFKVKAYAAAAFNIKKIKDPIEAMPEDKIAALPGVGKSVVSTIKSLLQNNSFEELENLISRTPVGVMAMLKIKGLGPKKVGAIWNEMGLETVEELFDACRENRLVEFSGFGLKTQQDIIKSIEFSWSNKGKFHYARVEKPAADMLELLQEIFPQNRHEITGEFRRKCEVIECVHVLTTAEITEVSEVLISKGFLENNGKFENELGHAFLVTTVAENEFDKLLFETTGSEAHFKLTGIIEFEKSETETYQKAGLPFIIPEMREGLDEIDRMKKIGNNSILEFSDLKGSLHNHSTYSDGLHSLEEMAVFCRDSGYEYLGICDHSKSAGYANGLKVERILEQHEEIDRLNKKLAPFFIFKGIESDILGDGSLDYENDILEKFDLVVASVHSNLKMTGELANQRLIKAIENPYTHILGHPTGRLLLIRAGYPIDHKLIIDACAANGVCIELNANPYRLDIDWRWVGYAMDKGVMISINPDAHEKHGYYDMYFGTLAARKAGLYKSMTLNAMNLEDLKTWLSSKRKKSLSHSV